MLEVIIVMGVIVLLFWMLKGTYSVFDSVVIVDVVLKFLTLLFSYIETTGVFKTIADNLPTSLLDVINTNITGTLNELLVIIYMLCYLLFIFTFFKRAID